MFAFQLKQTVRTDAGALGTVVGRAEYDGRPHSYLVRFTAEPQFEHSFSEGQLTPETADGAEPAEKATTKGRKS